MTLALSPKTSRFLALAILAAAVWFASQTAILIAGSRYHLHSEIGELRLRYADLRDRRQDLKSLEQDFTALTSSRAISRLTLSAEGERGAASRLQEIARKSVTDAGGKLVSLTAAPGPAPGIVATQLRASLAEAHLQDWLRSLESGDPRIEIADLSLTAKNLPGQTITEIDVTASLRARWRRQDGGTP